MTDTSKPEEVETPEDAESASIDEDNASDEDEDSEEMPASPVDVRENIKQKFLVDMPEDFYDFWKLCKKLNAEDPLGKLYTVNIFNFHSADGLFLR